jgi:ribosomal protein S11
MKETIENPIKVYIKVNDNNEIIDVVSSIFIKDLTGWIEIDSGYGDKYAHAQSQYFEKPLYNGNHYVYKYENNKIIYVGD